MLSRRYPIAVSCFGAHSWGFPRRIKPDQRCMGTSPDTRRSLPVVPLQTLQRYYGEATARLRRGYGGMSRKGYYATHYPENGVESVSVSLVQPGCEVALDAPKWPSLECDDIA